MGAEQIQIVWAQFFLKKSDPLTPFLLGFFIPMIIRTSPHHEHDSPPLSVQKIKGKNCLNAT